MVLGHGNLLLEIQTLLDFCLSRDDGEERAVPETELVEAVHHPREVRVHGANRAVVPVLLVTHEARRVDAGLIELLGGRRVEPLPERRPVDPEVRDHRPGVVELVGSGYQGNLGRRRRQVL